MCTDLYCCVEATSTSCRQFKQPQSFLVRPQPMRRPVGRSLPDRERKLKFETHHLPELHLECKFPAFFEPRRPGKFLNRGARGKLPPPSARSSPWRRPRRHPRCRVFLVQDDMHMKGASGKRTKDCCLRFPPNGSYCILKAHTWVIISRDATSDRF
jgi:hypothetical protein